MTRATLTQVAELAGVSLKTASRALGGEPNVRPETRDAVLSAARDLGYHRNTAASLLASGRFADSIGLITGDFTNPFYSSLASAIEDELHAEGSMHLTMANSGESARREKQLAEDLAARHARAVITVSAGTDHQGYAELQRRGVPVVFVDRRPAALPADSVIFDNRSGGRLAAEHLAERGHRDIAFIGDFSWLPTYQDRLAGIADALGEDGSWRGLLRPDAHDAGAAAQHARQLLDSAHPPTAFIAGNNRILVGVLEQFRSLPVAERPAVLGFDDPEWASLLDITVVSGDVSRLGRRAARLALTRIGDHGPQVFDDVVLPMSLVPRGSTAAPLR